MRFLSVLLGMFAALSQSTQAATLTRILGKIERSPTRTTLECVRLQTSLSSEEPTLPQLLETAHFSIDLASISNAASNAGPNARSAAVDPVQVCATYLSGEPNSETFVMGTYVPQRLRSQLVSVSRGNEATDPYLRLTIPTLNQKDPGVWSRCEPYIRSQYAGFLAPRGPTSAKAVCEAIRTDALQRGVKHCLETVSAWMRGDAQCVATNSRRISRAQYGQKISQAQTFCSNLTRNLEEDLGDCTSADLTRALLVGFRPDAIHAALSAGRSHPLACILHPTETAFAPDGARPNNSTHFDAPRAFIEIYGATRGAQLWTEVLNQNRAFAARSAAQAATAGTAAATQPDICSHTWQSRISRVVRSETPHVQERGDTILRQERRVCAEAEHTRAQVTLALQLANRVVSVSANTLRTSCPALYEANTALCGCAREAASWEFVFPGRTSVPRSDYDRQRGSLHWFRTSLPDADVESSSYRDWRWRLDQYLSAHGGTLGSSVGCEQYTATR